MVFARNYCPENCAVKEAMDAGESREDQGLNNLEGVAEESIADMKAFRNGRPSSCPTSRHRFDVFISFRGSDTRHNFTGHLYNALKEANCHAFMDDEQLGNGNKITQALFEKIEESKIALVVFSRNYASSTWCLDELVKIMECKKDKARSVYPLFYHLDQSEVSNQKRNCEEAWRSWEYAPRKQSSTFDSHFIPRCPLMLAQNFCLGSPAKRKSVNGHLNNVKGMADEHRLLMTQVQQAQPASVIDIMEGLSVPSIVTDNHGESFHGDPGMEQEQLKNAEMFRTLDNCSKWKQNEQVYQIGESPLGNGNKKPGKSSKTASGKKRNRAILGRVSSWSSILTFLFYGMQLNYNHRLWKKQESLSICLAWVRMFNFTAFLSSIFIMVLSGARFTRKQIIFLLISATVVNILVSGSLVPLYVAVILLAASFTPKIDFLP